MAYIQTVNRMQSGWKYPKLVKNGQISLVTDVASPGTAYQNASYGMAGLGTIDDTINSVLPASIAPYFTSTNYYAGFIGVAVLGLVLAGSGSGRKAKAQNRRKATLKGRVAMDQELLRGA